ncbi:GPI anchored cell wall protein [Penicillium macrosclerotiorum]|uniref:GPI anchored cell wall protein n=1 Tax=Penicillium macrosclerotiorum TaxID=303699 RepID=UPI002547F382|nr:GPI anchored cell wall protein [Penicillium macrosclerotiorum]KAJ5669150.1 GPI anchored cell wall protein [Penicillium macrosclerotiorum]
MKSFIALAAFFASANALVGRADKCCFHLTSSGGVSGSLGQLSDGQNRIGDNSLSPSTYCINSTGAITDSAGRGCIITTETTQFQCDEGSAATPGFSITSSGQLDYHGSGSWIACETGQNGGLNVYTTNSTDVTKCKNITITADSCSNSGSAPANPAPPVTIVSTVTVSDCTCPTNNAPAVPGASGSAASSATSSGTSHTSSSGQPAGSHTSGEATQTSGGATQTTGGASPVGGISAGGSQSSGAPHPSSTGVNSNIGSASDSHASGGARTTGTGVGVGPFSNTTGAPGGVAQPTGSIRPNGTANGNSTRTSAGNSTRTSTGSSTGNTGTSCPTTLSGDYQYPHLIVHIDSTAPNDAFGTTFNGTINSTTSSLFNFDIPSSYSGKTCSLVFLFPRREDLETSAYSFSGDGKIDIAKLSSTVSTSTTFSSVPSVSKDLGSITISPGNSYVVSTFSCPAGQAVAYEMKNAGSTNLNFFEDWNPSPLGLYVTVC